MVDVFLIKNDADGNPEFKFKITNFLNANIKPEWAVTPASLPEESSDQTVLVKLSGNMLTTGISWTLKDHDTNQEVLAGAATKTVDEQINFFVNSFQPTSIEDSFQIIYDYPSPIVFDGFIPSVQFMAVQPTVVSWTATAKFIQGLIVSQYELDTPTAPLNIVLSSPGTGEIKVDWSTPADSGSNPITGYRVQYAILGGPFINIELGVVTTTTISSLVAGTYNVRVLAKSILGFGRPSVLKDIVIV